MQIIEEISLTIDDQRTVVEAIDVELGHSERSVLGKRKSVLGNIPVPGIQSRLVLL
jgi:hypothetical protein